MEVGLFGMTDHLQIFFPSPFPATVPTTYCLRVSAAAAHEVATH